MIEEEDEAALKSVLFHVSIDVLPLFYVQLNFVSFSFIFPILYCGLFLSNTTILFLFSKKFMQNSKDFVRRVPDEDIEPLSGNGETSDHNFKV